MDEEYYQKALGTWTALNSAFQDFSEIDLKNLLDLEMEGKQRKSFIIKLHSAYSEKRRSRERRQLLRGKL